MGTLAEFGLGFTFPSTSGGGGGSGTEEGYWATDYWGTDYFGDDYWEDPDVLSGLPTDFVEAIVAEFKDDASLVDFNDRIWIDEIPARSNELACVLTLVGGTDLHWMDSVRISTQTVRFRVYHSEAETVLTQGQLLADAVRNWGALTWLGGSSVPMEESARSPVSKVRSLGPGALPRYCFEVTFNARILVTR